MMKKLTAVFAAFLILFVPMGCGKADRVYLEKAGQETELVTEDSGTGEALTEKSEAESTAGALEEKAAVVSEGQNSVFAAEQSTAGALEEQDESDATEHVDVSGTAEGEACYVYVCGAVEHPGVYVLKEGSRIYEAVALAGGLTGEASPESVNQAQTVSDGQMVRILTKEEVSSGVAVNVAAGAVEDVTGGAAGTGSSGNGESGKNETALSETAKVNLNTASAAELMTLPGIGQSKADRIIAYRETKGSFSGIEEIMNVEGIKEGVYNRIKDYIRVK